MRLLRSQVKRAEKMRHRRHQKLKSTDGPVCPYCEPRVNGKLNRQTKLAKIHAQEIQEAEC